MITTISVIILFIIIMFLANIMIEKSINSSDSSKNNYSISSKENKSYDFTNISTENVYKIYNKTSIITKIHSEAFKELDKRGYWDEEEKQEEKEAQEIYNKYAK